MQAYCFTDITTQVLIGLDQVLSEWRPDMVVEHAESGVIYNICGCHEKTNVEVVKTICVMFDELAPDSRYKPHRSLITFVTD